MISRFPELPDWEFRMEEVSAGVYEVKGSDSKGRRVSAMGTDLNELIAHCRREAVNQLIEPGSRQ